MQTVSTRYALFSLVLVALLAVVGCEPSAEEEPALYQREVDPEAYARPNPAQAPFYHGVASGDPLPDRVILWTRVTPSDSTAVDPVSVDWWIASDTAGLDVVSSGRMTTDAARDFTVKVDAGGLEPDRTYYYGFQAFGRPSPVGRTRTAPDGAADHLRFAVVSCSNYQNGYFNAYARIAEREDLSAVIHLGDYIYEHGEGGLSYDPEIGRGHDPDHEIVTLDDYRIRYAFYRLDPDLQRVHQQHPFITVWDDHEFANNAWSMGAGNHESGEGAWDRRKQSALQAFFEWLPVRTDAPSRIYRRVAYGDLVDFFMLDTRIDGREERDGWTIDSRPARISAADALKRLSRMGLAATADSTMRAYLAEQDADSVDVHDLLAPALGELHARWLDFRAMPEIDLDSLQQGEYPRLISEEQYRWLTEGLAASTAEWKVLGNQVQLHPMATRVRKTDAWEGFPEERARLLGFIRGNGIDNVASITGDIHATWVADVPADLGLYAQDPVAASLLVEFVAPAISARNLAEVLARGTLSYPPRQIERVIRRLNPHIKEVNLTEYGYLVLDVTEQRLQSDWYFVDTIERPDEGEAFAFGYFVRRGEHTLQQAAAPAAPRDTRAPLAPARPRAEG